MMQEPDDIPQNIVGLSYEALDERGKTVARHVRTRTPIARNIAKEFDKNATLGQRAADAVATFGGSWAFLSIFAAMMWSG